MPITLDLIIENADVVTMDPDRPTAGRVGVLDGRIVALDDDLDGVRAAEVIDLDGACLLPGLMDVHTHLQLTGQQLAAVDLSPCATPEAALDKITAAAAIAGPDEWIEVGGYDHRVIGRHLVADELDRAGGGRKVWVRHISSHASIVSHAVLDAAPDRELARSERIRDGLLEELGQDLVFDQRTPYSTGELTTLIKSAADQAAAQGVTVCVDCGAGGQVGSLSQVDGAAFQQLLERDELPVRMGLMPSLDVLGTVRAAPEDGYHRGIDLGLRTGFGSDRLFLSAQKVVLDGGMSVGNAKLTRPYQGTDSTGAWRQSPDEMREAIIDGHIAGWQMAVHAIGDAAVDLALDAFDEAQRRRPRTDARHRIEHGGVIRDEHLPRLAELGLAIVTQPCFIHEWGDGYADTLGPDREGWLYRGRSLREHGIRMVGSTDRPLPGTPLQAIQTIADRTSVTGRVIVPDERLTVADGLRMFTTDAAWMIGHEADLGRIAPHFLADFTVLERNPLDCPVPEVADIGVLGTAVAGRML